LGIISLLVTKIRGPMGLQAVEGIGRSGKIIKL
jgi:hypothetical protein